MKKNKIIFVHGGQGCGKSTITNLLREEMTYTTLLRLAGVPSLQKDAQLSSLRYHYSMLEGMNLSAGSGMNFVVDRSFLCEKVYANLGFKNYDFKEQHEIISNCVELLAERFDVTFVLLTANEETLNQRLNEREKVQFEGVKFDASNSINQQKEYEKEFKNLPENVKKLIIPTDNFSPKELVDLIIIEAK